MIRLVSLSRDADGALRGQIEAGDNTVDVLFTVDGIDGIEVVCAEPYVLGDGYVQTPEEVRLIASAVTAFHHASIDEISKKLGE
jgi:hypothetical protein